MHARCIPGAPHGAVENPIKVLSNLEELTVRWYVAEWKQTKTYANGL